MIIRKDKKLNSGKWTRGWYLFGFIPLIVWERV